LNNNEKLVQVYKAANEMEAQVIKGLLESYGIPCLLKTHGTQSVFAITVDGMSEVKVMVWDSMVARARGLIKERENA